MTMRRRTLTLGALAGVLARPAHAEELAPLPLQRVVTGDLPPLSIADQPTRPGVLVELVQELLRRCQHETPISFYPWARAMQMAQSLPGVALLPLTRMPEREEQFQWLLRLYVQPLGFINLASQPAITSLEQARRLRLAVLRGSAAHGMTQRLQLDARMLVISNSVEDQLRRLERGHVQGIFGSLMINQDKARSHGREPGWLQVGMTVEAGEVWLATGPRTLVAEEHRQRLREALRAMFQDGSVERLFTRYGVKPPRAEELLR
ncbi:substrate-binding periplasmic protein [Pelomonas sp. CA6]|uniref:substrate-binding periplasmic protein n=1 Tax=Pelomonas sp. CA6 TaxID=2907999 RepID=UPI0035A8344F